MLDKNETPTHQTLLCSSVLFSTCVFIDLMNFEKIKWEKKTGEEIKSKSFEIMRKI